MPAIWSTSYSHSPRVAQNNESKMNHISKNGTVPFKRNSSGVKCRTPVTWSFVSLSSALSTRSTLRPWQSDYEHTKKNTLNDILFVLTKS